MRTMIKLLEGILDLSRPCDGLVCLRGYVRPMSSERTLVPYPGGLNISFPLLPSLGDSRVVFALQTLKPTNAHRRTRPCYWDPRHLLATDAVDSSHPVRAIRVATWTRREVVVGPLARQQPYSQGERAISYTSYFWPWFGYTVRLPLRPLTNFCRVDTRNL
jgi:hypothetical protein